jgi:hypothetical protein
MTTQAPAQAQAQACVLEESDNTSGEIEFHIEGEESSNKKEQEQIVEKRVKRSYNKKKPTL